MRHYGACRPSKARPHRRPGHQCRPCCRTHRLGAVAEQTPDCRAGGGKRGSRSAGGLRWCADPRWDHKPPGYPFCHLDRLTLGQQPILGAIAVPFLKECTGGTGSRSVLQRHHCVVVARSARRLPAGHRVCLRRYTDSTTTVCWFTHRTPACRGGAAAVDLALWPLAARTAIGNGAFLPGIWPLAWRWWTGRWNRHRLWHRPSISRPGRCRWRQPACGDHRGASQVQPLPGAAFRVTAMGSEAWPRGREMALQPAAGEKDRIHVRWRPTDS